MRISDFPQEVERDIASAARAGDVTSRRSHVEMAALHLAASGASADHPERCRRIVEAAVFTRIAFTDIR